MLKTLLLICWSLTLVSCVDNKLFGEQGSELLKELKESGVIDQFEKELKNMLYDEEKKDAGKKQDKKREEAKDQNKDLVQDFVETYMKEKNIKLDHDVVNKLVNVPIQEHSSGQHFVKLTQIMDSINEIKQMNQDKHDKIMSVLQRVNSLGVMKTSLDKLIQPAGKEDKQVEKTEDKSEGSEGLGSVVNQMLNLLKKKPEMLLDMVMPTLVKYEMMSDQTVQMANMYGKIFLKSESFATFIDGFEQWANTMVDSDSGKRLMVIAPEILAADSSEKILTIIRRETEMSWNSFFGRLDNSDAADKFMASIAKSTTDIIGYVRELLNDDMKMALTNTFLVSQGLPALRPKKLTESMFALADKCIRSFTTWKLDLDQYKADTLQTIDALEKEYITAGEFGRLTPEEQETLIARFLRENMIEPLKLLWIAYKHITTHPDGSECAESIMCHLNAHTIKEGHIKQVVTRTFSVMAVYGMTIDATSLRMYGAPDLQLDQWKMYHAIWQGSNPETDCSVKFTPKGTSTCHIFPWQQNTMSLNFDHTEL